MWESYNAKAEDPKKLVLDLLLPRYKDSMKKTKWQEAFERELEIAWGVGWVEKHNFDSRTIGDSSWRKQSK